MQIPKEKRDKLVSKVEKLFRLSDRDSGTTPEEMELAAAQAVRLMEKFNIEMAELRLEHGDPRQVQFVMEKVEVFSYAGKLRSYMTSLVMVIEQIVDVKATFRNEERMAKYAGRTRIRWKEVVYFFGEENDVAVARAMYHILLSSFHREAKVRFGPKYNKDHRSFLDGVMYALLTRTQREKSEPTPTSESVALVLRSKALQVQDAFNEAHPNVTQKPHNVAGRSQTDAFVDGVVYGDTVDIGTERRLNDSSLRKPRTL